MSTPRFQVALTGDFFGPDGSSRYPDIGLSVFEEAGPESVEWVKVAEHRAELGADQIADAQGVIVLTPAVTARTVSRSGDARPGARHGPAEWSTGRSSTAPASSRNGSGSGRASCRSEVRRNRPMGRRLEGQTAWISGAASGIGEATARLFAEEGANVALVDVQADRGRGRVPGHRGRGGSALSVAADVSSRSRRPRSIAETVAAVRRPEHPGQLRGDRPRGLAARVRRGRLGPADGRQPEEHLLLRQARACPTCDASPRSYVVNVGSISSFVGQAATPAYTASKSAVLGLSRSIALDYAAIGLRCNCVCPGITDTPMLREHLDKTPDPEATLANRAPPRPAAVGPDAGRRRPGGPLPVLRGLGGRDGDVAGRRRRLSRRRGVGRAVERRASRRRYRVLDDAEAGLRGLHVPPARPRQGARPDRPARVRRRRHRPVRRPVAPLAVARLRRPVRVGPGARRQAPRPRPGSSPTSSCRPPPTSNRSPRTIPTRPCGGRRATGSRGRVEFAVECGGRHVSALPGVDFEGVPEAESYGRCCDELAWRCETARGPGHHVLASRPTSARSPRRPPPPPQLVAVGPRADADARLHPLHPGGRARRRGRAADRPRQPLPRPRRHGRAGSRRRSRRTSIDYGRVLDVMRAGRLRGVRRRRIRLDRLGALQRGRQPVGNDPDARPPPQPRTPA